jgi:hypothetical protein
MFNAKFTGLVIAGLLLGTGAAQAFPGSVDEAGVRLPARTTYAEMHRGTSTQSPTAFAGSVDETGIRLPARITYSDMHRDMPQQALAVFPGSHDEAGVRLQPRVTGVDQQRGRMTESLRDGMQAVRPASEWVD